MLLYFHISVRPSVNGVAPNNSPIKASSKIHMNHQRTHQHPKYSDTNHAGHIFGPDQTRHTTPFWLIKRIIKKTSAKSASYTLSYFSLITKLINIQMMIPTKERWKVDAFVKISAFFSRRWFSSLIDQSQSQTDETSIFNSPRPAWQVLTNCLHKYSDQISPHWTFFVIKRNKSNKSIELN